MQYTQRKLQRSVTEMRRSCIERPSVSRSVPPAKAGAGVRPELIGMTFITMVLLLKNHSRQGYSRGMESMKKRVAVIMQRRPMDNRWQSEIWEAVGVLADYDAPGEARVIVEQAGATQWLYPGFEMVLHRSESEGYYHNVSTQEPRVFVMWRMEQERAVPQFVTVSYDEASRWMDGGEQVDSVAMPAAVFAWVGEFVEKNYRPEPSTRGRRFWSLSKRKKNLPRKQRRLNRSRTMAIKDKTLKLCSCNKTITLDAQALASALKTGTPLPIHTELCRKEARQFQAALGDESLLVGCTQEAPLFGELAEAAGSKAELRFVNIREMAGWSAEGRQATPKIAALLAAAALPEPEPVPNVEYKSGGQILVIGPSAVALEWAKRFSTHLQPSVLITRQEGGELPAERSFPVWSGKPLRVAGWLGAFEVEWQQENPIDLEVCTRCNKCIDVCPENAIDFSYQIDLGKCKAHRQCVAACGEIGAVDFSRAERARKESFDLVLDLSTEPLLRMPDLPLGYLAPGADPLAQALAAPQLA